MRSSVRLLLVFAVSVASVSCLGGADSVTTTESGTAWVQFVNATSSSVQFLDAYDNTINESVSPEASSSCLAVNPASTGLLIAPGNIGGLTEVPLNGLAPNDTFVVMVMPSTPTNDQFNVFFQAFTPAAGDAGLRVINASPVVLGDAGQAIDAYVAPAGTTAIGSTLPSVQQPAAAAIAFPHGSGYFNVVPGTFDIAMTNTTAKAVIADAGSVSLTAGTLTTVVVEDPAPDSINLAAFVATTGCSHVATQRVRHE